ncbi:hypothetical protein RHMOL_Rhmol03G0189400 [Rhododendron molle]|uniref:Uncharacterized protein n=1 Tax=Rhododendron molle TaxID=49168 RepID=A0ACC0PG41_RHOML|nr:hypothetical protein RHMOL_Rhmol03G0189400 [Rhododendron molle]
MKDTFSSIKFSAQKKIKDTGQSAQKNLVVDVFKSKAPTDSDQSEKIPSSSKAVERVSLQLSFVSPSFASVDQLWLSDGPQRMQHERREGETIIFDIDPLSNPYYFAVEIRTKSSHPCDNYQGVDLADASSSNQNNWKPMRFTPSMDSSWALDSGGLPLRAPFSIRLTDGPSQIQVAKKTSSQSGGDRVHLIRPRFCVLKWEDVEIGEPKEGEIKVKNKAIGLNFIDVYFRKGVYKASTMPFTPGMEAAGVVTAVGPGLTGRKVGDFVAYAGNPMGSYAEEQILPAEKVVPVPPSLDPIVAASVILKGMTAHMLVRRCFKVEPGHTVLVHAAAGGVGSLLCQWANALGATVIGTVSTTEKAAQAKEDGCHHVIMYKEEDFVTRVNEITSGKGVDVVYDSVGKDTFQSSGMPDPIPMTELAAKSLFLTRAALFSYNATRDELLQAAGEVFSNVASGILRVRINHKYPLSQVAQAHEDLEGRKTSGSVVLIPDGVFEQ